MTEKSSLSVGARWLRKLGIALSLILMIGLLLSISIWICTSMQENLFSLDICFTNKCVSDFGDSISTSLAVAKSTLDICVAVATIGGIFVALLSYINTANNNALTNHIEHLKVFSEYLESEIKKRDRLRSELFDSLLLYSTIFNESRHGNTAVSKEYIEFIVQLNNIVIESNQRCTTGTPGGFSYRDHQKSIRDHLAKSGITVYLAPRNDYMMMEAQLFSLINRVNQSFCPTQTVPAVEKSTYV